MQTTSIFTYKLPPRPRPPPKNPTDPTPRGLTSPSPPNPRLPGPAQPPPGGLLVARTGTPRCRGPRRRGCRGTAAGAGASKGRGGAAVASTAGDKHPRERPEAGNAACGLVPRARCRGSKAHSRGPRDKMGSRKGRSHLLGSTGSKGRRGRKVILERPPRYRKSSDRVSWGGRTVRLRSRPCSVRVSGGILATGAAGASREGCLRSRGSIPRWICGPRGKTRGGVLIQSMRWRR